MHELAPSRFVPPTRGSGQEQVARAEGTRAGSTGRAQMEEKLANGLRDLEALHAEASRPCPEPGSPH